MRSEDILHTVPYLLDVAVHVVKGKGMVDIY